MKKNSKRFSIISYGIIVLLIFSFNALITSAEPAPVSPDSYQILHQIQVHESYSVNKIVVSPEGSQVAFVGHWGYKQTIGKITNEESLEYLMVNDKQISPEAFEIWHPMFSPDGKNITYVMATPMTMKEALKAGYTGYNTKIMQNDKLLGNGNGGFFSADGTIVVYTLEGDDPEGKSVLMMNDQKITPESGTLLSWELSPLNQLAYMAQDKKTYYITLNGQNISGTLKDVKWEMRFAPHSNKLAYFGKPDKKWALFFDGQQVSPDLEDVDVDILGKTEALVISPDGTRVAYKAKVGKKWYMMVNDQQITELKSFLGSTLAGVPVFSPDSSKIVYYAAVKTGKWHLLLNDQQITPDYDRISSGPVFRPDGAKIAYAAEKDGVSFVMLDDQKISPDFIHSKKPSRTYTINSLAFSPDGTKLIYKVELSESGSTQSFIVINDRQVSPPLMLTDYKISDKGLYFAGYDQPNHQVLHGFVGF